MTVLTAVDGEVVPSDAVEVGQSLADRFGESHVVLHVMPQEVFEEFRGTSGGRSSVSALASAVSYGASGGGSNAGNGYSVEDGERHAAGVARDVVRDTLDTTDGVVLQGRVGDPVEEIMAETDRRDARYLVIGRRKRSPVGKAVFGSVTQSVLLGEERPVVTVPSE